MTQVASTSSEGVIQPKPKRSRKRERINWALRLQKLNDAFDLIDMAEHLYNRAGVERSSTLTSYLMLAKATFDLQDEPFKGRHRLVYNLISADLERLAWARCCPEANAHIDVVQGWEVHESTLRSDYNDAYWALYDHDWQVEHFTNLLDDEPLPF